MSQSPVLLSTVCPTCIAQPGESCNDPEIGEVGVHASRRRLVDGRIDSAEDFAGALTAKFVGESVHAKNAFGVSPGGQRYLRIWQGSVEAESVHCFVDAYGNVYKAAGWKAPAKGVRYTSLFEAFQAADLYGGYLYKR